MMRTAYILLLILASASCEGEQRQHEFTEPAHHLFTAATSGDSARLNALISDTLVLRDLSVLEQDSPTLMQHASEGLILESVADMWSDSAYVHFRPSQGEPTIGVDIGFVRRNGSWRVYYVGRTGYDVRRTDRTKDP